MKYIVFRSFGSLDKDIRKHELIAVEYGKDIYAVTNALIYAVASDMAEAPEFKGYSTAATSPQPVNPYRKVKRYNYEMYGIAYPLAGERNTVIEYGVKELCE